MKVYKIQLLVFILSLITITSNAQLSDVVNKVINSASSLTEKDAADGIKEALSKGTGEAVKVVSNVDGYFKNTEIKIPFPKEYKVVSTKLRDIGMGKQVDKFVLSMNRAAETAAKEATSIFITAVKNMTITDAVNIVKGNDDAATQYLKKSSSTELNNKFKPVIKSSLDQVYATKYWSDLIKTYNKIPMVQKMNPDLTAYVTGKAIDGLFVMVAKEELKIRKDPLARTSEILKKVFGAN
jgi:hypothetical protein